MNGGLDRYEPLLVRAALKTEPDAELHSHRVYYSARDPLKPPQRMSRQALQETGGRRYRGKISRGKCVDAAHLDAVAPAGLSGSRILYMCNSRPEQSRLYRRSGEHRGHQGLLEDRALCRILAPYYPVR